MTEKEKNLKQLRDCAAKLSDQITSSMYHQEMLTGEYFSSTIDVPKNPYMVTSVLARTLLAKYQPEWRAQNGFNVTITGLVDFLMLKFEEALRSYESGRQKIIVYLPADFKVILLNKDIMPAVRFIHAFFKFWGVRFTFEFITNYTHSLDFWQSDVEHLEKREVFQGLYKIYPIHNFDGGKLLRGVDNDLLVGGLLVPFNKTRSVLEKTFKIPNPVVFTEIKPFHPSLVSWAVPLQGLEDGPNLIGLQGVGLTDSWRENWINDKSVKYKGQVFGLSETESGNIRRSKVLNNIKFRVNVYNYFATSPAIAITSTTPFSRFAMTSSTKINCISDIKYSVGSLNYPLVLSAKHNLYKPLKR